jgi:hypothetical protein
MVFFCDVLYQRCLISKNQFPIKTIQQYNAVGGNVARQDFFG